MRKLKIQRPSPAMVVGCIALFVAMGGVGYAAVVLPANSVGTTQLKAGAVRNADIYANAVNGAKIAPNSVSGLDLNETSLGQVPSAANANTLDGVDSRDLGPSAVFASHGSDSDQTGGCPTVTMVTQNVTIAKPSRVFVSASFTVIKDEPSAAQAAHLNVLLKDSGGIAVGSLPTTVHSPTGPATAQVSAAAVLTHPAQTGTPYVAAPGNYTVEMQMNVVGSCDPDTHVRNPVLITTLFGTS
jgi:hypothetical protein